MGPLTRGVQTGIGLVAELKAARQARKEGETGVIDVTTEVEEMLIEEKDDDDHDTEDDENFGGGISNGASDQSLYPPPYGDNDLSATSDIEYPQPSNSSHEPHKLSCPVIIPQRRPGTKTRGFLEAYAPVLADCNIGEGTFLTFLRSFHKSSQASPVFNVITMGAGAISRIHEPHMKALSMAISVLSGTAADIQSRYRTNKFLDQANDLLFKPRGLYCLVMSLRPDDVPKDNVSVQSVDTSSIVLKWLDPDSRHFAATLRTSSGTTHGGEEMPETAPLIYPNTGYAELVKTNSNSSSNSQKIIGEVTSYQKVVENYFDKRAQAKYAYEYPDSSLAMQEKPQFASKYGDPTDPSVTTNYYGRIACKIEKESLADRQARRRAKALEVKRRGGGIKRFLHSVIAFFFSVLYLMIVSLPSEEELNDAKKALTEDPGK
ncbi:uncharacterized protein LY89DRAFT_740267 [Mollisia scopiformis]|uniref:Uncharacterized protein n=1 Tax=Mollisia scopiformis TaxID=149040 RepID=A0A132BDV2_MOLSC|nr:uncharacterized protein LY89DRAFT_740267 [Mollisia scopiformis]KUJ10558.1 hypothetical protein LY89DRAFT_740267 [Mollisia scopiformis]